jgi:hypothetical protein
LDRRGIEPAEVYLPMHFGRALLFVIRELELLLVGAPMALFGIVNHFLPYFLVKDTARALVNETRTYPSCVIAMSPVFFSLSYALQLTAAWLWLPAVWAGVYTLALPYTGYYALLYHERRGRVFCRSRTFLHFWKDRTAQERLAQEGRSIIVHIRELDRYLSELSLTSPEGAASSANRGGSAE